MNYTLPALCKQDQSCFSLRASGCTMGGMFTKAGAVGAGLVVVGCSCSCTQNTRNSAASQDHSSSMHSHNADMIRIGCASLTSREYGSCRVGYPPFDTPGPGGIPPHSELALAFRLWLICFCPRRLDQGHPHLQAWEDAKHGPAPCFHCRRLRPMQELCTGVMRQMQVSAAAPLTSSNPQANSVSLQRL